MSEFDAGFDQVDEVDEQEIAEAMATGAGGCETVGVGIPLAGGKPVTAGSHPGGHPGGHPSGMPPAGHPGGHPGERQRHGGARSMGFMPGGGPAAQAYQEAHPGVKAPRIIAWEITRSCNLGCVHCRAAAEFGHYPGELSLDQCKAVIDDIATISNPIIILTGGEPLMRPDIWEIIDYAHVKGCMPVVGTNATLITDEIAHKLAEHGIPRISVSIDFATAEEHDAFRRQPGAFDASIEGIKRAKATGVGVQINTTVTKLNAEQLPEIHDLAERLGVDAFHIFMLVPTGRGSEIEDLELPPEGYEKALTWAYERQKTSPLHFKPTDSPHYYRIIRQLAKAEGKKVTREEYGMDAMTRGCLGGITFSFISHIGDVQPCGYFDQQLGNVKEQPYSEIWTNSKVFNDLRDYSKLEGKCGACEYKGVCGGCRARALALTGDYMEEEPYCAYVPPSWTPEMAAEHAKVIEEKAEARAREIEERGTLLAGQ
ncbi:MAG: radical SAM protein [Coriobacteriia bacterium]|nr:radical SAM protein [Coriobacteriia bacterium]